MSRFPDQPCSGGGGLFRGVFRFVGSACITGMKTAGWQVGRWAVVSTKIFLSLSLSLSLSFPLIFPTHSLYCYIAFLSLHLPFSKKKIKKNRPDKCYCICEEYFSTKARLCLHCTCKRSPPTWHQAPASVRPEYAIIPRWFFRAPHARRHPL